MALLELLSQRKDSVSRRWSDGILETYQPQAAKVMKRRGDPFANPIGESVRTATAEIIEGLAAGRTARDLVAPLERIVKVRSIQDFTPSQAIGFILELRGIIRDELAGLLDSQMARELQELEAGLEQLTLLGFDIYVACREQYHEVRVSELKRSIASMVRRAGNPDLEGRSKTRDADE